MQRMVITAAAMGAVALLATGISWGGRDAPLPGKSEQFEPVAVHPVDQPSAKVAAKGKGIQYFQTNPFPIAADARDDSFVKCPRRTKVLTGYYGTEGGVFADYFALGGNVRRWDFGLLNVSGEERDVFLGLVCK